MEFIQYNTSLRSRILALEVGEQLTAKAKRTTLQNYASVIKEVTGRKYKVHKHTEGIYSIFRYE